MTVTRIVIWPPVADIEGHGRLQWSHYSSSQGRPVQPTAGSVQEVAGAAADARLRPAAAVRLGHGRAGGGGDQQAQAGAEESQGRAGGEIRHEVHGVPGQPPGGPHTALWSRGMSGVK